MKKYLIYIAVTVAVTYTLAYGQEYAGDDGSTSVDGLINDYNHLCGEIAEIEEDMAGIEAKIDMLDSDPDMYNDTLSALTDSMRVLNDEASRLLVQSRRNRYRLSEADMVFSSVPVMHSVRRAGYINRQIDERAAQLRSLHEGYFDIRRRKDELVRLIDNSEQLYAILDNLNDRLWERNDAADEVLSRLTADLDSYHMAMNRRILQADTLNRRVIYLASTSDAAPKSKSGSKPQAKKSDGKKDNSGKGGTAKPKTDKKDQTAQPDEQLDPESKAFAGRKGSLPMPVETEYTIVGRYGEHGLPDYPEVKVRSNGIDIEVKKGTKARAVADGTVSAVFVTPGYHNVVMVRHGQYITVYANISNAAVKKGDTVKADRSLGTIYSDTADKNRTILHFEVRKGKRSLNPLEWVKR